MEETVGHMDKETPKKVKEETEKLMEYIVSQGIDENNVDFLYKIVDIHKDIANEEYWQKEKEEMEMRYGRCSEANEVGNYGRRYRDSMGRYSARGYDKKYRGEEMLEEVHGNYQDYSESREHYSRGNYGAKEDTMKSLEYMLQSVVEFMTMLKQDASSQEEVNLIKEYSKHISEM